MKKLRFKNEPFIIKNKRFSTLDFIFLFPYQYEKKDMYNVKLLKKLLASTSKKYPTEQGFKQQLLKKMIIGYNVRNVIINKNLRLHCTYEFGFLRKIREKYQSPPQKIGAYSTAACW